MDFTDLKNLIFDGENQNVEFKRKIASNFKIARSFVSFANTDGGLLLLGVGDSGEIIGIESEKNECEELNIIANYYCTPAVEINIEIIPFREKDIIVVEIPKSNVKPHYAISDNKNLIAFVRVSNESVEMNETLLNILKNENKSIQNYSIGEYEKKIFEYIDTNEIITVSDVEKLLNVPKRKATRLLTNLHRIKLLEYKFEKLELYFTYPLVKS